MQKTVLERLELQVLPNGRYPEDYSVLDEYEDELFDEEDLILFIDPKQTIAMEALLEVLDETIDLDDDTISDLLDFKDHDYYHNTIGTLLFALQAQYKHHHQFERITLRELSEYSVGQYIEVLDAYDLLVHSNNFEKEFLLELGKQLILHSFHEFEFIAGLVLLSNFDYEEVLNVIPQMSEVIKLTQHYFWWQQEMIGSLYLWELDEFLFENLFETLVNEQEIQVSLLMHNFHPLKQSVNLFLSLHTDLIPYWIEYWRYLPLDRLLRDDFSIPLLIGILDFMSSGILELKEVQAQSEKRLLVHTMLVKGILVHDIPYVLYNDIFQYFLILEKEDLNLQKELSLIFLKDENLVRFCEKKIESGQLDWLPLLEFIKEEGEKHD